MLQQQRLRRNGADTNWAEQLRESHEEVDREDDEVAHVTNGARRQSYAQDCPPWGYCVTLLISHPQVADQKLMFEQ